MQPPSSSRPLWLLIAGLVILSIWVWLFNSFPPDSSRIIVAFCILAGFGSTLLFSFVFNSVRRGLLLGGGFVLFLILRLIGLHSVLFLLLLAIVLLSLELTWKKR